ncbi:uncharacterized protein RJT21DRAFT_113093 [Scheffersomyces amazonensis]|uniref:uncharacterized protein n=1 Tax=Scheffersomyces amazonensis TaxID=1078765 RepID=UPI00315D0CE5
MNLVRIITIILQLFLSCALADVALYEPGAMQVFTSNSSDNPTFEVDVKWLESNATPLLSQVSNYTLVLCNGTVNNINPVVNLTVATSSGNINYNDKSYSYIANITSVNPGSYFIQVLASSSEFFTIHYTNRFFLSIGDINYDELSQASPPPLTMFFNADSSTVQSINTASYGIPNLLQTGSVKYAPMQTVPPQTPNTNRWTAPSRTTIKSFPIYTKIGGYVKGKQELPTVEYTITQPPSYVIYTSSNSFSPAQDPSGYYDPQNKVQVPVKITNE